MNFQEEEFNHRDTLCYVIDENEVLMIQKKRGLKPDHLEDEDKFLNGPGGSIENETPLECAIREVKEETGIIPNHPQKVGEIGYYAEGNPERFIHVYRSEDYSGSLEESEEAKPVWKNRNSLEYDNMWPSDSYWMSELLDGTKFKVMVSYSDGNFDIQNSEKVTGLEFNE